MQSSFQRTVILANHATYPELLIGFDEKVEFGRAIWWRLLGSLVVDS
jgi:hypothetical protein